MLEPTTAANSSSQGPDLQFTIDEWRAFIASVADGEFDF